jgi:hypothetical protein
LLHEAGASPTLIARSQQLEFHDPPPEKERSLWQRMRHPSSGLGPGMRSRIYSDAPLLFHKLPEWLRLRIVGGHLHPAAGWPLKQRFEGRVPALLGCSVERAEPRDGGVQLKLTTSDGVKKELWTEMVVAATGFKVDLRRLEFLGGEILSQIDCVAHTPILNSDFQSSVPGLYFVGVTAANSFGPVLRFAFGSGFAASHFSKRLAKTLGLKSGRKQVAQPVGALTR